ncbi:hypothetical protein HOO34_09055 [Aliarcobacter cryaerophilus]|uniref:Uncharacterized protein n=1 Tax=Aliarcobacter cryaerophilus TaxID=28198 RepID=A0A7G9LMB5_9BACT|nr:hypothetical protein [Aliarcobacter cryaerophilus]QNM89764.1 hypothetical protein HOO34_09055 [Aliarcobacter cryaerophilus]
MLKREIIRISLELRQIKLLLKNKNIEIDNNSGQVAGIVEGNQNQINNNYSLNTFNKPLKNYNEPIKVKSKSIIYKNSFYSEWFAKFLFYFVIAITLFNLPYLLQILFSIFNHTFIENEIKLKELSLTLFVISFYIFTFYLVYNLLKYQRISDRDYSEIKIENDKLILNNEEIRFLEIRSFVKEKFMFNYQFFIFKETKKEATIKFSTNETDTAIAIEELLNYKIEEAIKIEEARKKIDLQIAKKRSLERNETISLSQMRKLSDEQM